MSNASYKSAFQFLYLHFMEAQSDKAENELSFVFAALQLEILQ